MFENLNLQPPDKIMALMVLYAQDGRNNKIDLGVGVYKDQNGKTPIMGAIKDAEQKLFNIQKTKSYVGLLGSLNFINEMTDLTLGNSVDKKRVCGAQAPGGTGALHQLFLLLRAANSEVNVWISNPSWPNHAAILKHLSIRTKTYTYFDEKTCGVNFNKMLEDLNSANNGDILLLHGCCHNPTGANLSELQWRTLANVCEKRGLIPLIDIAYQGFGDGLGKDVVGMRNMASLVPEMMVAASCSKNFGVYRDRVGAAIVVSANNSDKQLAEDNLKSLNRLTFSFPPDHGASVVETILAEKNLYEKWSHELESMRRNMLELREGLTKCLQKETKSDRFDFIEVHRGMFSRLGLSEKEVTILREDFGIYMISDSRINIAGLQRKHLNFLASSIAKVI